jgi:sortase (surface protein transpeptidase)
MSSIRFNTTAAVGAFLVAVAVGGAVVIGIGHPDPPATLTAVPSPPRPGDSLTTTGELVPTTPAASAVPEEVAAPMTKSAPVRLLIPAIGVDSTLVDLGLQADGTLQVPRTGFPAGWYSGAPTPGELGPAIIVGHIDWGGRAGVFYRLRELKPNDEITVARADGSTAAFRVTRVQQFPKDQFPTALVYGNIDFAGLRLITCGGTFDQHAGSYRDDTIVFAELIRASRA